MRPNLFVKSITLAAATLCATGMAMAASSTVNSTASITAATATSNNGNGGAAASRSSTVNFTAASFDDALGVLTGVSATLSGGTLAGGGGAAGLRQGTEVYSLAGSSAAQTVSVGGNGQTAGFAAQTLNSFASLSSFVTSGAGTVGSSATYTASADRTGASGATSATITAGTATQALTYTYLQHANASFGSGADLNTLSLAATGAGTSFDIYALANTLGAANTTRLDALSFSCVSGCGAFQLNLASFGDLVAGSGVGGSVKLLATAAGSYAGQYLLSFMDDTAVGVGQKQNTLTLNVSGFVAAPVPEPETYALLLAGLGAMGFISRRRRQ
jgi:hypothetical protein